jgi:hypothetical protein
MAVINSSEEGDIMAKSITSRLKTDASAHLSALAKSLPLAISKRVRVVMPQS